MAKKAPTARQLAARARFAAMARSQRGPVALPGAGGFRSGFFGRARSSVGNQLKAAFHRMSWGVAALSFVAGYYLPTTLSDLGLGYLISSRSAVYSDMVNYLYQTTGNPAWANWGIVGVGKLAGAGYIGKKIYDLEKGGKIGQASLNVGMPFALGLLLDGPELHPWTMDGGSSGMWDVPDAQQINQGGVSW